jgi:hypothetical protein
VVISKRDQHHTSTKLQLTVIRWVHELCKQPSYARTHACAHTHMFETFGL